MGISQDKRFVLLGDAADIDTAISNLQYAVEVDRTSDDYLQKSSYLHCPGKAQESRYEVLDNQQALEAAISNFQKAVDLTESDHLKKTIYEANLHSAQSRHII
jgi:flagellar biosynthesis/type III secretory pathway chaperone